jgi:hypothetical protein
MRLRSPASYITGWDVRPERKATSKPHDAWSKDELWAHVQELESKLSSIAVKASRVAGEAHNAKQYGLRESVHEINSAAEFIPAIRKTAGQRVATMREQRQK